MENLLNTIIKVCERCGKEYDTYFTREEFARRSRFCIACRKEHVKEKAKALRIKKRAIEKERAKRLAEVKPRIESPKHLPEIFRALTDEEWYASKNYQITKKIGLTNDKKRNIS